MKKFLASCSHALHGVIHAFKSERNFRIQIALGFLAIFAGVGLQITRIEWLFLIVAIVSVLVGELCNTAIEKMANIVSPGHNELIRHVKDMMAGMVLLLSIGAVIVGMLIFLPYVQY